ncbi:hypothetical protein DFJ63DRAFT_337771 [Scheffersomyces coipomensis]|uniref:uncharacterized protein n=1 Tax=Scheffersomyces coipomensis TaxID=1788519 RepID=UPI00315D198F
MFTIYEKESLQLRYYNNSEDYFTNKTNKDKKLLKTVLSLTKDDPYNVIPLTFSISCSETLPIQFLNDLLSNVNNFELSLRFLSLNDNQYQLLRTYKKSSDITSSLLLQQKFDSSNGIILDSNSDWPPNVLGLSLLCLQNIQPLIDYGLPANLEGLCILATFKTTDFLSESPPHVTDLVIGAIDGQLINFKDIFKLTLQYISLYCIEIGTQVDNIYLPPGLEMFEWQIPVCSSSLDFICFDNAKSTLNSIELGYDEPVIDDSKTLFTKLDFSEFSSLTYMKLDDCNIINLDNFFLPISLEELEIHNEHFDSLDQTCPFLSDSYKYPLTGTKIDRL